jgi:hypothetical protein
MWRDNTMGRGFLRIPTYLALTALGAATMTAGCGGSPTRPSAAAARVPAGTIAAAAPGDLASGPADQIAVKALPSAARLSRAEVEQRGWTCFVTPVPDRVVCSRPNQGFPTIGDPPPPDRPASFTFLVFNAAGQFRGTELLLRTDLYSGQVCESTGAPYDFVPVIGYYECVHTIG